VAASRTACCHSLDGVSVRPHALILTGFSAIYILTFSLAAMDGRGNSGLRLRVYIVNLSSWLATGITALSIVYVCFSAGFPVFANGKFVEFHDTYKHYNEVINALLRAYSVRWIPDRRLTVISGPRTISAAESF